MEAKCRKSFDFGAKIMKRRLLIWMGENIDKIRFIKMNIKGVMLKTLHGTENIIKGRFDHITTIY